MSEVQWGQKNAALNGSMETCVASNFIQYGIYHMFMQGKSFIFLCFFLLIYFI